MKPFSISLIFLFYTLMAFSQSHKLYITSNGKLSTDAKKAVSYVLIEKAGDTIYLVSKYDMNNGIILKGAYKDSAMKVPNGQFFYYGTTKRYTTRGTIVDTNRFVGRTGYYSNGLKSGTWIHYMDPNTKLYLYTYKDGKLNGLYQEFNLNNGKVFHDGNFVNDKMEGEWNTYQNRGTKPIYTQIYLHDKLITTNFHSQAPIASPNLDKYIETALGAYIESLRDDGVVVKLSLTEEGKVDSILSVNKPLSQDVNEAIAAAFLKCPNFQPALVDDKPIKQIYYYNFKFGSNNISNDDPAYRKIFSKHPDDIDGGLK